VRVTVTGGAGYVGACAVEELLAAGHDVRILDVLLHEDQSEIAAALQSAGAEVMRGDIRDTAERRRALAGADAVVHLAAIVGDPACARSPELAQAVNVEGSHALAEDARTGGVTRFVFASTCSNYGRLADPAVPVTEDGVLAPLSLYAEQKVGIERALLDGRFDGLDSTCLRFATVYGAAPRMRFDLTINEFTRELWAGRELEVFGEQFWRPYIHVRDAARAIRLVLEAPRERVAGQVFNVGDTAENYRKVDLVRMIVERLGRGDILFVSRDEDPRDYKVSFDKIASRLGYEPRMRVSDGIDEIVRHLEEGRFGDPFRRCFSNI
jgi:nucleoside-diphosphate-sugar epimerase